MKVIVIISLFLLLAFFCPYAFSQTPVSFTILQQAGPTLDLDVDIATPDTLAAVYLQLGFAKGLADSLTSKQAGLAVPDMEYSLVWYTGDKDKDYVVLMATAFDQNGNEKALLKPGNLTLWSFRLAGSSIPQNIEIVFFAEASLWDASLAPVKVDFKGQNIVKVEQKAVLPTQNDLLQNYPNPFNDASTISFRLAANSQVKLEIFNSNGQTVATLVNGLLLAGEHSAQVPARLSSGIFFYRLTCDTWSITRKMSKIR